MSARLVMRSQRARLWAPASVLRPKSTNSAWMSWGGTAVAMRLSQAWVVTGGPLWFGWMWGRPLVWLRGRGPAGDHLRVDGQAHRQVARPVRVQLIAGAAGGA